MTRFIYSLLLYLITPLVFLKMLLRSRKAPAYRKRWGERLGFVSPLTENKPVIWIHSVSVGETIASMPLVKALRKHYPNHAFLITTMTPTGSDRVKAIYGDSVAHSYIPYDLPCALSRFFKRINPAIAIIIETELWPNTIAACHKRKIPTVVANARLSERSANGYAKLGGLTRSMLQQLSVIACQNSEDGERFLQLGLPKESLQITGSVKFDITLSKEVQAAASQLRTFWETGFDRKAQIFIAASTHDGEEQRIIDAFLQLKQRYNDLLLILVPRHPERFNPVYELACNNGLRVIRHSQQETISCDTDVILGDTMGEMMKLFAASDIAFVGGSLINRGGHNVLEPAAVGLPVLSGTYTFNFQEITSSLEKAEGLIRVENTNDLIREISRLLTDKRHYDHTCTQAKQFVESNRGALNKLLTITAKHMPEQ